MCTHLHVDHVGWNTRLENGRWVPTFPKARYLFSKKNMNLWATSRTARDPTRSKKRLADRGKPTAPSW